MASRRTRTTTWALRGVETLHLRIRQQDESALQIAQWLSTHPKVSAVIYPGLPTHPQHDMARCQMRGFSGVLIADLSSALG